MTYSKLLIQFLLDISRTWVLAPALPIACRTNNKICNNFQPSIRCLKNELSTNILTLSIQKEVIFGLFNHIENTEIPHITGTYGGSLFAFLYAKVKNKSQKIPNSILEHSISH